MTFGAHVDNAIRQVRARPFRVRTDLSATLFLSRPDEYDGGELVVEDTYGTHAVKLPAGDMILYPATSLHRVDSGDARARGWPRSSGSRAWCATTASARCSSISTWRSARSTRRTPDHPGVVALTSCYHNLLRRWADA